MRETLNEKTDKLLMKGKCDQHQQAKKFEKKKYV